VANSVATFRETPFNIQLWTGNPAGATLKTTLIAHTDAVALQFIDIRRTDEKARLPFALLALLTVNYLEMALFLNLESV